MQEERMQVLKMIDEGKITVDEATKLLNALGAKACCEAKPTTEEKWAKFQEDTKEFFKEMGQKINQACEKAKPKIESAAKTVVAKTAQACDNIAQSLNEKVAKMQEKESCCGGNCCGNKECVVHHPADNGQRPA
ncbi:MAG: hypothetical protein FWE44_01665 [Defluviitaleaceae bacterium]|nr:hypothetical protein [Defluviitaleaceae bacterium]